jgi:hypothetical protein
VLGSTLSLVIHRADLLYPCIQRTIPSAADNLGLRRFDPTCRLKGWRTLASQVDQLRDDLRATGVEPIIAASSWAFPGEMRFYGRGNPPVYSIGRALGDRHSQYDLWRPNPIADAEGFLGRTFIVVGYAGPALASLFDEVGPAIDVTHRDRGIAVARWTVCVCRGYRGVAPIANSGY